MPFAKCVSKAEFGKLIDSAKHEKVASCAPFLVVGRSKSMEKREEKSPPSTGLPHHQHVLAVQPPSVSASRERRPTSRGTFLLLFVFVLIEILGFSIILPLFPYLVLEYDASPVVVGCLMAANALTQFVGAPFLGRLSDLHGTASLQK